MRAFYLFASVNVPHVCSARCSEGNCLTNKIFGGQSEVTAAARFTRRELKSTSCELAVSIMENWQTSFYIHVYKPPHVRFVCVYTCGPHGRKCPQSAQFPFNCEMKSFSVAQDGKLEVDGAQEQNCH